MKKGFGNSFQKLFIKTHYYLIKSENPPTGCGRVKFREGIRYFCNSADHRTTHQTTSSGAFRLTPEVWNAHLVVFVGARAGGCRAVWLSSQPLAPSEEMFSAMFGHLRGDRYRQHSPSPRSTFPYQVDFPLAPTTGFEPVLSPFRITMTRGIPQTIETRNFMEFAPSELRA